MIKCFFQTEQYMLTVFCFLQIKCSTTTNNHFTVPNKCIQNRLDRECFWYPVNKCHHVVMICLFELCMLVQEVQYFLWIYPSLESYYDTSIFCRKIIKRFDTFEFFFLYEICDRFYKSCTVHTIWQRRYSDLIQP